MRNKVEEIGLMLQVPNGVSSWNQAISDLKIQKK